MRLEKRLNRSRDKILTIEQAQNKLQLDWDNHAS
jgi:hypothetical protein